MHDPLTTALEAHRRGWTPVLLQPGTKKPTTSDWPLIHYHSEAEVATAVRSTADALEVDPAELNVGLALGPAHGHLVDIDVDHPRLIQLAWALLPDTPMKHGRERNPGSHYWYRISPDDPYPDPGVKRYSLPNRSVLIEYRSTGGQTVLPESRHPEGDLYQWEGEPFGGEDGPALVDAKKLHAAVLMIALLGTLADAWPGKGGRHDAYLALVGGLLRDVDEHGRPRLHPLWDRNVEAVVQIIADLTHDQDGARSRIAEAIPSTRKKILADKPVQGWPTLAQLFDSEKHANLARDLTVEIERLDGSTRLRRSSAAPNAPEVSAAVEGGTEARDEGIEGETYEDRMKRFESKPLSERDPLDERGNSWRAVDASLVLLQGLERIQPSMLRRDDGNHLLYRGKINSLYGSGGGGKTWIALHAATEVLADGGRVMMIDFEDEPRGTLYRLMQLDPEIEDALHSGRFAYICPEDPISALQIDRWGNMIGTPTAVTAMETLSGELKRHSPELIIIDGVTTLYGMHGLNTNDAVNTDAIGRWLRSLTAHGERTVLLIDHTSKNAAPGATPTGSQHKIAMIQGVALQVYTIDRPRPGKVGKAHIYVGKDRQGGVAEHATDQDPQLAAEVSFDSTVEDRLTIEIKAPAAGTVAVDITDVKPGRPKANRADDLHLIVTLLRDGLLRSRSEITAQLADKISEWSVKKAIDEGVASGRLVAQHDTDDKRRVNYTLGAGFNR